MHTYIFYLPSNCEVFDIKMSSHTMKDLISMHIWDETLEISVIFKNEERIKKCLQRKIYLF